MGGSRVKGFKREKPKREMIMFLNLILEKRINYFKSIVKI
jgi:hypothetical protein